MWGLLCLNRNHRIIHERTVFVGGLIATTANAREIYQIALKYNAASIIVAHNHPSGDPTPSEADVRATDILKKAGEYIGIPLYDHIIIGNDYYSFKSDFLI
jgi:DNA repair protein RadC